MSKHIIFFIFTIILFISVSKALYADEIIIPITSDTYSEGIFFDEPHGHLNYLLLGFGYTARDGITRLFINYDHNKLNSIPPEGIESVYLYLYPTKFKSQVDLLVDIYNITSPWSEIELTEFVQPIINTDISIQAIIPIAFEWVKIDVTSLVKQQSLTNNQNGIVLKMRNEDAPGASFWSKDCLNPQTIKICTSDKLPYLLVKMKPKERPVLNITSYDVVDNNLKIEWSCSPDCSDDYTVEITKDNNHFLTYSNLQTTNANVPNIQSGLYLIRVLYNTDPSLYDDVTLEHKPKVIEEKIVENPLPQEEIISASSAMSESAGQKSPASEVSTVSDTERVLSVSTEKPNLNSCIFKYNLTTKAITSTKCKIYTPKVIEVKQKSNNIWTAYIDANITFPQELLLTKQIVKCKDKTMKDPRTFISCIIIDVRSETRKIAINNFQVYAVMNKKILQGFDNSNLNKTHITIPLSYNINGKSISFYYDISYSEKIAENVWFDLNILSPKSKAVVINSINNTPPPYIFPFKQKFNVTQWHGNTVYQKPHTGIDFEVTKQEVMAISNGTIDYIGWDSSGGKCLSGGNYIRLKHNDGKYSLYLHLSSFTKGLKKGSKVNKGTVIAKSGNTGLYNCEQLSDHLHFELRKQSTQKTHINPIPYVDIDWNSIRTANSARIPGRLSGDNPHPLF